MNRKLKNILLTSIVTYFLIELTCFIFIKSGYIRTRLPDFDFSLNLTEYPSSVGDIDPTWGIWHYKEHFLRKENCLNFDYSINSLGAYDTERVLTSKDTNRVFVLGDSFLEGYGIPKNARLTDLLEKSTNREFLNFSCQQFGTTQEYLVYKQFHSQLNHSTLLIGIFPNNDFIDNDTVLHINPYYKTYRPYFKGTYPDYRLVYVQDSLYKSNYTKTGFFTKENSLKAKCVRFFRSYTCWFNILTYIKDYSVSSRYKQIAGYYDYTPENWNKMRFILKKIDSLAANKRIIILTIPTKDDIVRYRKSGTPPLHLALDSFCRENNMQYVDLLPPFAALANSEKLFYFDCDAHWNEAGNRYAAELLKPLFSK